MQRKSLKKKASPKIQPSFKNQVSFISKKCPHCGFVYSGREKNDAIHYGSPFLTCPKCGESFVDKSYHELALEKKKNAGKPHFGSATFSSTIFGLVIMFFGITSKVRTGIIAGIVVGAVSILVIVCESIDYKKQLDFIKEEANRSADRLSDPEYAQKLKDSGFDVPEKYLPTEPASHASTEPEGQPPTDPSNQAPTEPSPTNPAN